MLYEYKCAKCNNVFEIEHKINLKPRKRCPNCKKYSLKRLISMGGNFILKGKGWFKDGY